MTERRTSAPPKTIDGVTFHCYHLGIMRTEWRSEDGRLKSGATPSFNHWASVDGQVIGNRYRSTDAALCAAVKALRNSKFLARRLAVMN